MATVTDSASVSDEIWTMLRTLFGRHRRRFLIAAGELDLHPAQAGALLQLGQPMPMHELAAELGCDNSNVTGLVDRLTARGLVNRMPSDDDRRVRQLVLTDAGRQLRGQLLARLRSPVAAIERLAPDSQRELLELLRQVLDAE